MQQSQLVLLQKLEDEDDDDDDDDNKRTATEIHCRYGIAGLLPNIRSKIKVPSLFYRVPQSSGTFPNRKFRIIRTKQLRPQLMFSASILTFIV